jgi:hypothetical protein
MSGTEAEEEVRFRCRMIIWVDALTICHLILKRNDSGKSEESDAVTLQVDICADIGGASALVYNRFIEFEKIIEQFVYDKSITADICFKVGLKFL